MVLAFVWLLFVFCCFVIACFPCFFMMLASVCFLFVFRCVRFDRFSLLCVVDARHVWVCVLDGVVDDVGICLILDWFDFLCSFSLCLTSLMLLGLESFLFALCCGFQSFSLLLMRLIIVLFMSLLFCVVLFFALSLGDVGMCSTAVIDVVGLC